MAGLFQRLASRVTGLALPESVRALQDQVASLESRVRMRPTSSGVPISWGAFDYEYASAMKGSARWELYDRMESDPHIKAGLDALTLPLVTALWEVQPASDKAEDIDIAEFVAANLLRKGSEKYGRDYYSATSWAGQRLPEILDFLKCGFALFSKSTKEVDGRIVYDRIQWLEPRSVDPHGWKLTDDDRLVSVDRTYETASLSPAFKVQEPILARQLALYVWDLRGARLEGRSKLRSVYGAFLRKDFIAKQAAIWAQKVGAPMPVAHYPHTFNANDVARVHETVKSMRGQAPAEAYAVFPKSPQGVAVELSYVGAETGEVDRMRGLIEGENGEIAHGMGIKSRLLGETQSGSRSLGESLSEDEDLYVQAVAQTVCELENDGVGNLPGLVQELVNWNFANVREYPKLIVSRVGPREDFSTLEPLIKAVSAGLIPKTPELMRHVTEKFGIKLPDDAYEIQDEMNRAAADAAKEALNAGDGEGGRSSSPDDKSEDDARSLAIASDMRAKHADLLRPLSGTPPKGASRMPNRLESEVVDLAAVATGLDGGRDDYHQELRVIRDEMTADIIGRLRAGKVTPRNVDGLRRSKFRRQSRAEMRLLTVLERIVTKGALDVESELDRMGK